MLCREAEGALEGPYRREAAGREEQSRTADPEVLVHRVDVFAHKGLEFLDGEGGFHVGRGDILYAPFDVGEDGTVAQPSGKVLFLGESEERGHELAQVGFPDGFFQL